MDVEVKKHLLERLNESHTAILKTIEGFDLEVRVYGDKEWRIREILGHIASWDREVSKTLRAFMFGNEYAIPGMAGDETDFNEQAVKEQLDLSSQQIVADWKQAREDFKATLSDIPVDRFPGDLLFPWGDERGSIAQLVDYMIEHDEEHQDEIANAVQKSQTK